MTDPRRVVQEVVAEAVKRNGKAANVARLIEPVVGHRYSESTVSSWGRGRIDPPASAFIAIAMISGLSVDERLDAQSLTNRIAALEARVSAVEAGGGGDGV